MSGTHKDPETHT